MSKVLTRGVAAAVPSKSGLTAINRQTLHGAESWMEGWYGISLSESLIYRITHNVNLRHKNIRERSSFRSTSHRSYRRSRQKTRYLNLARQLANVGPKMHPRVT